MLHQQSISQDWRLRMDLAGRTGAVPRGTPQSLRDGLAVSATVPGCVHTDLMAAGLLDNPCHDRAEWHTRWVGRADWRYDTTLRWAGPPAERVDLVFDGIDTVADVLVGGEPVGATRNMHRSYRFDVTAGLTGQSTDLSVRLTSAYTEGEAVRQLLGGRPANYHPEPYNFLRKMACNFGWDWGPTVVTAGLWRPVRLEGWHTARLARVRPLVTVDGGDGRVRVHVDLERAPGGAGMPLRVEVAVGDVPPVTATTTGASTVVEVVVPRPALWWPRGHGQQPRYDCAVRLSDERSDAVLDRWRRSIGFRTVDLDTAADERGSRFTLVVNGRPVFARGVNWIPDDVFPHRVDAARYRARLTQAAEANVDLVRVWGGGRYESDDFYDACDELGLMVWQDFPFACAAYPEEEPLLGEVAAEAAENIVRLAPHPSLVLWNGNNECDWGHADWGWREILGDRSWGGGYYHDLLPRLVHELDPTRPYWDGTPWSGRDDAHPNDPDHGTVHSWDVWNRVDYAHYRDSVPRFVAEFGWLAPPAWATMRAAVTDEPMTPGSPGVTWHQRAADGDGKLRRGLDAHFAPAAPDDFDRWHFLTQVNQVRAIATGIEHWRSHWPDCAGAILWQLNDCWPVTSWAAVDSAGRRKPLHHELRRLYADRLLTVQPRDGVPTLLVVNNSADPWAGTLLARRLHADGRELAVARLEFAAPAHATAATPLPAAVRDLGDPSAELIVVDADGLRALWFARPDRDFAYPPARPLVEVAEAPGGLDVRVTADALLRDLLLQPDRLHPLATVDAGLLTLLPGESATLRVRAPAPLDPAAVGSPPVLWAVNYR